MNNTILQYIKLNKQDAVLFKAEDLAKQAGDDTFSKGMIFLTICNMLSHITNEFIQGEYVKKISKILQVKPIDIVAQLKKETKKKEEESIQYVKENEDALPKWVDKEHYYKHTFVQREDEKNKERTGIYFSAGESLPVQLTNFTMKAIAHVKTDNEGNRRLAEINNGYHQEVVELPSRLWSSAESFENILNDKGVFFTKDGFSKSHLSRLKAYFLPQFVSCFELENLGWQPEGFFAYANLIFHKDQVIKYDEFGIAKVEETNYLSMGVSKALAGLRKNKSVYDNDNFLKFLEAPITFQEWTKLMMDAYQDKGMMGVCFGIMACFKDLIFSRNNNCPIPYAVGAAQSGKSKFMESVANIFTHNMPALNLNQTTEYALWERLGRFSNVGMLFNEFDENSIKEEYTRAFKGAYDGEGRNRGTGRKGKSETQPINCLPFLLGQYLTTSDDGAILQRTLPVKFVQDDDRPDYQVQRFEELKRLEKEGITSLSCEVVKHRQHVADNYGAKYAEISRRMKQALTQENLMPKTRILENYVNAMTVTLLIHEKIQMAFTSDEFFEYCKHQIMSLSLIINESNALSGFWSMMEFLVEKELIEPGYDFKIETKSSVIIAQDRKENITKSFQEPKKLLFIRFNSIHKEYLSQMRNLSKKGLDDQTILIYMKDQQSYIGNSPSGSFRSKRRGSTNTSSYVFDYEMLKVNLERTAPEESGEASTVLGKLISDAKQIVVIDTPKLEFTILTIETLLVEGVMTEKKVYTRCFSRDLAAVNKLKIHTPIKVSGSLNIKSSKDQEFRTLEVFSLDFPREMNF
jgi:hypothetical protein